MMNNDSPWKGRKWNKHKCELTSESCWQRCSGIHACACPSSVIWCSTLLFFSSLYYPTWTLWNRKLRLDWYFCFFQPRTGKRMQLCTWVIFLSALLSSILLSRPSLSSHSVTTSHVSLLTLFFFWSTQTLLKFPHLTSSREGIVPALSVHNRLPLCGFNSNECKPLRQMYWMSFYTFQIYTYIFFHYSRAS